MSLYAAAFANALILVLVWALRRRFRLGAYLALRNTSRKQWFSWLSLIPGLWLLREGLLRGFGFGVWSADPPTFEAGFLELVSVVILAPIGEEIAVRGFLYKALDGEARWQPVVAIVLPALLWAMLHSQYSALLRLQIFVVGVLLGCARRASGSLFVPIVMHMQTNALAELSRWLH